ncbi:MAG: GNAT family N-acetyltransferase [Anaerolineae bacterium]|nr:GNAT family N-acetyltransferase [Anaerolineae bacterium]MDW8102761.1 GNAT family N-acetyltransferase [Anaerolineae bacterium]
MESLCLRGERVILCPLQELLTDENLRRIYSWHRDQEIMFWMGCRPVRSSFANFASWFRCAVRKLSTEMAFGIINGGGELIGRISCYGLDEAKKEAEIGILIGEKGFWGKGYGQDALVTFLRYLFEEVGLRKVRLRTLYKNLRARRCFSRCGFQESRRLTLSLEIGEVPGVEMTLSAEDFYKTFDKRRPPCKSDSS